MVKVMSMGLFQLIGVWLIVIQSRASASSGSRKVVVKNSCRESVRVGLTVGAVPSTTCSSDQQCSASGGVCNLSNNLCFYKSFFPNQHVDLEPKESFEASIAVSEGQMYSGAIFVSTGCDSYQNACETGICRNKACDQFTGAVGPHTRAEFTFNPSGVDFYDISYMHGVNVPMSMVPTDGQKVDGDAYSCGGAGSIYSTDSLPGCDYKYNPNVNGVDHTSDILFVAPSNLTSTVRCQSDSDCNSANPACGLTAGRDPTGLPTTTVEKVCGNVVGLWSADEVCIYSAGQFSSSPYFCSKSASKSSYTDLYGCAGAYANSGYQAASVPETTCGCFDWDMPVESKCRHTNPEWESVVLPWVKFVKEICPVAYSYAFDDMTSTFTCGTANEYVIEMCPGGVELSRK